MKLKEVGDFAERDTMLPLQELTIWEQDVTTINKMCLMITFSILANRLGEKPAAAILNDLSADYQMESLIGEAPDNMDIENFCIPTRPILLSELKSTLSYFTEIESKAIMFALYSDLSLENVVSLTRTEAVLSSHVNPMVKIILSEILPNLRVRHLFWQKSKADQDESLSFLPSKFIIQAGITWVSFAKSSKRVLIDGVNYSHFFKTASKSKAI
jgi:hypothetical protein